MAATQRILKVHTGIHACIYDLTLDIAATHRILKVHADLHACIFDLAICTEFLGDVLTRLGVILL